MKLIVSDFDLTFFDNNYENNIKLINEFAKKGNKFVIATGRFYSLLEKDINNKNINFEYLICTSGSIIMDKSLKIIKKVPIEKDLAQTVNKILESSNIINKIHIDEIDKEIYGIYAVFTNLKSAQLLLNQILNKYNITGYISTHGINFVAPNIDKSVAVEYIQKNMQIKNSDIYTVGDNNNDLEMIKKYNGYVVGNKLNVGIKVNSFKEFMKKITEKNS